MNPLTPFKINRIACYVMVALLSACGGGGGGSADQAATPAAAVAASPTPSPVPAPAAAPSLAPAGAVFADLPAPPVSAAAPCPPGVCVVTLYDQLVARVGTPDVPDAQGYLVPSTDVTTTGGEPPYPDLRMLPTRIAPFVPIVFGDVSSVSVTAVR
jgi:hypothetical protein